MADESRSMQYTACQQSVATLRRGSGLKASLPLVSASITPALLKYCLNSSFLASGACAEVVCEQAPCQGVKLCQGEQRASQVLLGARSASVRRFAAVGGSGPPLNQSCSANVTHPIATVRDFAVETSL